METNNNQCLTFVMCRYIICNLNSTNSVNKLKQSNNQMNITLIHHKKRSI